MTDIVERLRDKWVCAALPELAPEAADTIEALRQRVKDWERRSESCESKLGQLEANERVMELESELAALRQHCIYLQTYTQQGEPLAWIPTDALDQLKAPRIALLNVPLVTYEAENHSPLYTSAPSIPKEVD